MARDNIQGVFMDADFERMIDIHLPLVKSTTATEYGNRYFPSLENYYGEIMTMGDIHIGHEAHSFNPFNAHLHFISEHPHMRLALFGDYFEYAAKTNFIKNEVMFIDDQIDYFVKKMKPIADRIIFILYGNHDERYCKQTDSNRFLKDVAREIGVPENIYIGAPQRGVYAAIHAGKRIYGMYAHHSLTSARVNKYLQLQRAGSQNVFSIVGQGHTHEMAWIPRTFRQIEQTEDGLKNVVRRQYLLSTGCFIKDPSYGEARSYPYTVVGAPIIRFYANKDKLEYYDLSQDYKDYLSKGGISFGCRTGVQNWKGMEKLRHFEGITRKCLK